MTPRLSGSAYAAAAARATPPRSFARFLKRRSVEGFLFPAGYEFLALNDRCEPRSRRQIEAFEQRWRTIDLRPALARKRTPYDVLTIASLVEREAAVASERVLISAVIYNRLDRGMPLAIDASLRYGLGVEGTRPLTERAPAQQLAVQHAPLQAACRRRRSRTPGCRRCGLRRSRPGVDYLYYLRRPNSLRHFFTASEAEFCAKAIEYGYEGC